MDATVVVALIGAGAGLVTTGLNLWQNKRITEQQKNLAEVHDQVQNSHKTNLRDDMDRVLDKLDDVIGGQRRHDKEIAGIREDLRQERQERMALAARVDNWEDTP